MSEDITESGVFRLKMEAGRQRRLVEASYALHTTLDLVEVLQLILKSATDGVEADRGTVFLLSEDGKELWSRVVAGDQSLEIRLPVGKGIAGVVAKTGEVLRIKDAYEDPRFDQSWDKQSGYRTRQILCAPIRARDGRLVGVFQLLNKREGNFTEADAFFLDALSVHASLAVENARLHESALEQERQEREIQLVQNLQRAIQPESAETEAGAIRVAGLNVLCEDASGDYYDFIDLPSGRLGVVIGDVSGHGLHAALVMAQARAFLRAFCTTIDELPGVMNLLNDFLTQDLTRGSFMTLFLGVVDPATHRIEWSSAGHLPALVVRAADGRIEELPSTGRVLGILPDAGYQVGEPVMLESGDVLLLYTDGATEALAPDGAMFKDERLRETLSKAVHQDPAAILQSIRAELTAWTGREEMEDDLTLVVLKRT